MLVICCGNLDRGDDGAGLLVAQRLRSMEVPCVVQSGEALSLIEAWRGVADVVVVDAVITGAPPGTISVWDAHTADLAGRWFRCSTHFLGVAEAVGIARNLNCLPRRLRIYGIEARRFEPGSRPSAAVMKGVEEAAEQIVREYPLCLNLL
jgi:hydrogenase maturation protease